jgi:hypothetical protein
MPVSKLEQCGQAVGMNTPGTERKGNTYTMEVSHMHLHLSKSPPMLHNLEEKVIAIRVKVEVFANVENVSFVSERSLRI